MICYDRQKPIVARKLVASVVKTTTEIELAGMRMAETRGESFPLTAKPTPMTLYNIEMMKLLVARGAATDIQNHKGETPLMLASLNDRKEAVILLLEEGADVHLKNSKGESALTYAFLNKEIQSVIKTAMKKK